MVHSKLLPNPMACDNTLSIHEAQPLKDPTLYCSMVGALQYCIVTCPNICFAVNKFCQFMHCPTDVHQKAVKWILQYLHGIVSHGISIVTSLDLCLTYYTDVDQALYPDDRRSTSGYYTLLGSNLISWSSSKQKVVSHSSIESEYRGLANAVAELTWMESLLYELQISFSPPPLLFCDNISATYVAVNPILHSRTKHVEIDYHFVHEKVSIGSLVVHFTPFESQLANIMTRTLPTQVSCIVQQAHISPRSMILRGMLELIMYCLVGISYMIFSHDTCTKCVSSLCLVVPCIFLSLTTLQDG